MSYFPIVIKITEKANRWYGRNLLVCDPEEIPFNVSFKVLLTRVDVQYTQYLSKFRHSSGVSNQDVLCDEMHREYMEEMNRGVTLRDIEKGIGS